MFHLADDVMELILRRLNIKQTVSLFLTGNRRIQSLVICNVTRVVLDTATNRIPDGVLALVAQFPKLKTLEFESLRWDAPVDESRITSEYLMTFKGNIKILLMPFRNVSSQVLKTLPKSLTRLELKFDRSMHAGLVKYLPEHLLALRLPSVRKMNLEFAQRLPKYLEEFEIGENTFPDAGVPFLPPNLTILHLMSNVTLTDAAIGALPRNLTELYLNSNPNLSNACIPALPRSITALILGSARKLEPSVLKHLPPHLKTLLLNSETISKIQDSHVSSLSRDLVWFPLTDAHRLTEDAIPLLPPALVVQKMLPTNLFPALALKHVESLPNDTLVLSLPFWIEDYLDDRFIARLPPSITTIKSKLSLSDAAFAGGLPPMLQSIYLTTAALTNEALQFLPETLTGLSIPKSSQITDAGIASLPRSLKHLDLSLNRNISDEGVAQLPPNLLELIFHTNNRITDVGISLLPRSLKTLDLSWNRLLSDEGVRNLPPTLIDLDIGNTTKLTSICCDYFPKTLKRLLLNARNSLSAADKRKLEFIRTLTIS